MIFQGYSRKTMIRIHTISQKTPINLEPQSRNGESWRGLYCVWMSDLINGLLKQRISAPWLRQSSGLYLWWVWRFFEFRLRCNLQPPSCGQACLRSFFYASAALAQIMSGQRTRASRMSSERVELLRAFYEDMCSPSWVKERKKEIKKAKGPKAATLACLLHLRTITGTGIDLECQVFSFVDVTNSVISELAAWGSISCCPNSPNRKFMNDVNWGREGGKCCLLIRIFGHVLWWPPYAGGGLGIGLICEMKHKEYNIQKIFKCGEASCMQPTTLFQEVLKEVSMKMGLNNRFQLASQDEASVVPNPSAQKPNSLCRRGAQLKQGCNGSWPATPWMLSFVHDTAGLHARMQL